MRVVVLVSVWLLSVVPVAAQRIQVLAWSERSEPADIYPTGINGAFADIFATQRGVNVTVANLLDPDQGLSEEALAKTDVLVWFGHHNHADVSDEAVERVVRHVTERGMGFLALHSAHASRPFQELMRVKAVEANVPLDGRIGRWAAVRNEGKSEQIRVLMPGHPIARGIEPFPIPETEMYVNPLNAPPPDAKVFEGSWEGGEQHGSDGLVWLVGRGKVFYFRPGHETRPIYLQPEVQQILRNAIPWLAKPNRNGT
jgi:trehalose utilization protein